MRILLYLATAITLSSCINSKQVDRLKLDYDVLLERRARQIAAQTDSINVLTIALARSEGGNDLLLKAQSRLEDKLILQKDELDDLKGNLSTTSSRMSTELTKVRKELETSKLTYDTLLRQQAELVNDFQEAADDAAILIAMKLDAVIPAEHYRITQNAGEMILSVQEDVLFQPRSISRIKDESAVVFRAVMDALQDDPLLKLTIVGHTDNQPNPRKGTDNWQFAALRATTLADELATTYYLSPNRVMAASHGEFRPVTSNATEEGRRANRRVDFVLRNNVGNLVRELGKLGKE